MASTRALPFQSLLFLKYKLIIMDRNISASYLGRMADVIAAAVQIYYHSYLGDFGFCWNGPCSDLQLDYATLNFNCEFAYYVRRHSFKSGSLVALTPGFRASRIEGTRQIRFWVAHESMQ